MIYQVQTTTLPSEYLIAEYVVPFREMGGGGGGGGGECVMLFYRKLYREP